MNHDLVFVNNITLLSMMWNRMIALTSEVEQEATKIVLKVNAEKTKIMKVGKWTTDDMVHIDGKEIKPVEEFFYLGSVITLEDGCNKDIHK